MVKGKKKGKKEAEEVPSVSGLSIADTPSTSQAQVVEDSGALGLTGAALRKYKKQKLLEESNAAFIKPLTSSSETKAQVKPEPEKPEPKPEVKPEPPKEDEPEGLGLGLGGGGKKKTKKKKPAAAAQAATTQVVPDAGPVPQPVLEHKGWGQPGTQAQQGPSGAQFPPGQSRSQSTFEQWGPQAGLRQPEPQPMLIQPGLQPGLGQPFPPMAAGPQPGLRQPFPPMGAGPQPRLGQPLPHMAAGPQPGLRQPFPPMGAGPQPRLGQPLPHMAAGPQPGLRQPFPPMGAGPQPRLGQPLPHMAAGPQPGLRQPFPSMRAGPQPGLGQPLPHMAAGPQPGLGQPFPPMGAGPQPGLGQPLPHMAAGPQPGLRQPFPPMGAGPPPGLGQPRPAGAGRGSKATRPLPDLDHGQAGPTSKGGPWQADPQQREPPTQPPLQGQPMATTVTSQRPSPASSAGVAVLPKSRQEIICKYTIPHKVLGNTVRNIPIRVITNYLAMEFDPIKVYRYDVAFKPERPKKMIPNIFKIIKQKYYPNEFIAFDQVKNCYSLNPLKNIPSMGDVDKKYCVKATITDPNGRNLEFEVSIQQTGIIDFGKIKRHMESGASSLNPPAEEIQCIDVILRQGALEAYVKSGRQFFKRPAKPIDLSGGLEMWTGLFQSAIFTSKAFINIDVAHKGFPIQQSMIQALTQSFKLNTNCRVEEQRNRDIEGFQSFVRNLRVVATLVGPPNHGQTREFICNGLVDPPFKLHFSCERNGKNITMSVGDYFAREKGYKLKYPNLNCMWVGPREKGIYYPLELLEIAYGQPLNRQLNDMQLSNMVKEAATPPIERKRKIEEVTASMNYSRNAFFKKFGLQISSEFLKVEAKILTPPNLDVGERNALMPRKGSWQTNRLLKPEALVSWGFIALECNPMQSNYECIRDLLLKTGRQMGMEVAEPRMQFFNVRINELRNILFSALEKEVRFLFVIVGGRAKDTYHKVKQMAERDVGILTQCIKEYTASRRMNVQTIKNILLKVNSKLMGINQVLDSRTAPPCLKNGDVMIVGADVTHPSPDQTHIPSIAAVTASMDAKGFSYNIELSIQTPKKEMIVEFQDMMFDHLKLWRERHNSLPRKIYVFRDGVSEGQFGSVMNSELDAVHLAYRRFSPNAKPEVLFLLVQKRHHTRFFTDPNCANVEPGTVVDTHIVHPKELDFYLVSHQAIKGTARPTRYHAICNDGKIPHDQVEQLTYYLCHLYARCMRSVSYPTPTYYAHLACLRARSLTYGQTFDNASLERQPQRLRVLDKMLKFSRMFFV